MPPTYLGHGLGQRCCVGKHLSQTPNLSQALIAGLPAKLNSAQLRRQAGVPGRSAAYENQALEKQIFKEGMSEATVKAKFKVYFLK